MTWITENHNDDVVYWAPSGKDTYGARTFSAPVDIKGRWEDEQIMFVTSDGRESVSKATVSLGQAVEEGGYLYLGTVAGIASSIDETNPKNVSGAYEIRGIGKVPDIRSTVNYREAIL